MTTLGDKIIIAAIRYQTAASSYQQHDGYSFDLDISVKKAFNDLRTLADRAVDISNLDLSCRSMIRDDNRHKF